MRLSRFGDWLASTTMGGGGGGAVTALATSATSAATTAGGMDMAFRRVLLLSKLFTKSWGHPSTLKQLAKHRREVMSQRVVGEYIDAMNIELIIEKDRVSSGVRYMEGRFRSPHACLFPHQMEGPLQWAHWKGIFPLRERKGLCIHLAGTGDHTYYRREFGFANDLLKDEGMASILLQNPYYTDRKPPQQFRSSLENVSDLFVMGAALMSECNYLLRWAKREGYGPLAISGVSMGGYMASLAASNIDEPVVAVPILSWTSAAPPYTEGAIAQSINYPELQKQIQDPHYLAKIREIPDVTWIDQMYTQELKNGRGLAYNMMRILMDEFTLLSNYPVPLDTSLCTAIVAENDAYVLRNGAPHFEEVWPGMTVETMPKIGHVQGYIVGHALFRKRIAEYMKKAEAKYPRLD